LMKVTSPSELSNLLTNLGIFLSPKTLLHTVSYVGWRRIRVTADGIVMSVLTHFVYPCSLWKDDLVNSSYFCSLRLALSLASWT
jgi:hypothetical protein